MYRLKKFEVWASEIAGFLNCELVGEDFLIEEPSCIHLHSKKNNNNSKVLLLTREKPTVAVCPYLITSYPELSLGYVLREFFSSASVHTVHHSAVISDQAKIGRNVKIGPFCCVGPDVELGDNTILMSNVVLNGPLMIGKNCVIKDGAVIGSEGWGFVFDEDGIPFHPPQLGKIVIDNNVWIGANATIERAMVAETRICTNVKIDDLVHIGGATHIGTRCMITAGSVIASSVVLKNDVIVSPHSVIRENIKIGPFVQIGQGAVVVKDLLSPGVYVGNPARLLKGIDIETDERRIV